MESPGPDRGVAPTALQPLCADLHRYAGWLDQQRTSATVRADISALAAAVNGSADAGPFLLALDGSLERLPSGEIRKLLRATAKKLRSAIATQ